MRLGVRDRPAALPMEESMPAPPFLLKSAARRPRKGRHLSLTLVFHVSRETTQIFYVSRETAPSSRRRRSLSTATIPGIIPNNSMSPFRSPSRSSSPRACTPGGLRIHIGSCRRSLRAEEENPDVSPGTAEASPTYSSGKGDRSQSSSGCRGQSSGSSIQNQRWMFPVKHNTCVPCSVDTGLDKGPE